MYDRLQKHQDKERNNYAGNGSHTSQLIALLAALNKIRLRACPQYRLSPTRNHFIITEQRHSQSHSLVCLRILEKEEGANAQITQMRACVCVCVRLCVCVFLYV
jgi:hypothetical protein